jgi:hypothetical protein
MHYYSGQWCTFAPALTLDGSRRKMKCEEIQCAANGAEECLFEVRPA